MKNEENKNTQESCQTPEDLSMEILEKVSGGSGLRDTIKEPTIDIGDKIIKNI